MFNVVVLASIVLTGAGEISLYFCSVFPLFFKKKISCQRARAAQLYIKNLLIASPRALFPLAASKCLVWLPIKSGPPNLNMHFATRNFVTAGTKRHVVKAPNLGRKRNRFPARRAFIRVTVVSFGTMVDVIFSM